MGRDVALRDEMANGNLCHDVSRMPSSQGKESFATMVKAAGLLVQHIDSLKYRIEGSQKMIFAPDNVNINQDTEKVRAPTLGEHSPPCVLCLYSTDGPLPQVEPLPLVARHLSRYVIPAHSIAIPRELTSRLVKTASAKRPAHRPTTFNSHDTATVHLDAARYFGLHTVLVEFKAKSGTLSTSKLIPPTIARTLGKYTTPTYHVKNYLMCYGRIPEVAYNPADLLSTDVERTAHAVNVLMLEKSRALRMFKGGKVVQKLENFRNDIRAATQALLNDVDACQGIRALQAYDHIDTLGADTVMSELKRRVGSSTEAERLVTAALRSPHFLNRPNDNNGALGTNAHTNELRNDEDDEWQRHLSYESPQQAARLHCDEQYKKALAQLKLLPSRSLIKSLVYFLQAAAAKDCSLLVALGRYNEEQVKTCLRQEQYYRTLDVDGVKWMFRIWVVDIGEKEVDKISTKWPRQDIERAKMLSRPMNT